MAEAIVYRRKRAKHPFGVAEAGKITMLSTDERDEKIIVYERRKHRKKQLNVLDEKLYLPRGEPSQNARIRTISTDKGQDAGMKTLSTDKGHEKIIVYKRRNLTRMQLKDLPEARRNTIIATDESHEKAPTNERYDKVIDYERGMLRKTELNDLPEEILGSILSRLPLRDAVRTSILSTKLRRIWTCHPDLDFTSRAMFPVNNKRTEQMKIDLIQGMLSVLKQHRGSGVKRIVLRALLDQRASSAINACVRFAFTSRAKSLSLLLSPERPYCFPTYLFDTRNGSKSVLEELYLKFVSLRIPPGFTGFTHLKRLDLFSVYDIVADELQDLLKNCLLLERLCLCILFKFEKLVISESLSHLRFLSLTGCHEVKRIEISAANLERFEFGGTNDTKVVFTQPLQKVRYASIQCGNFDSRVGEFVLRVLPRSIPGVQTLVWKTEGIEMDALPNCLGRFQSLKRVQIDLCATRGPYAGDVLSFAALLDVAPLLESFFLKLIGFVNHPYSGIEELRRLPNSSHHHLKFVGIQDFTCSRDQIELVEYILENAIALNNMIIETRTECYRDAAINSTYMRKDERMQIMYSLPFRSNDQQPLNLFRNSC